MIERVKITDKYSVDIEDGVIKMIFRYDEPWRECIGDKFILACVNEIQALRELLIKKI